MSKGTAPGVKSEDLNKEGSSSFWGNRYQRFFNHMISLVVTAD